jgi:hypothetical protein
MNRAFAVPCLGKSYKGTARLPIAKARFIVALKRHGSKGFDER